MWVDLLRCYGAIAVGCIVEDSLIKVGILAIEPGRDEPFFADLVNTETGDKYPVRLPGSGAFYSVAVARVDEKSSINSDHPDAMAMG